MKTEEIIHQLEKQIKTVFHEESSGHDIYHLKRVLNLALTIQKTEGGNMLIIAVSSFLHDVHRIIQKETGEICSPKDSLGKVEEILNETNLSKTEKEKILHCIEFHEEYYFSKNGKTVNDIETLILQDADNLDALGAIGIGRTFAYHGANKSPMWIPEVPLDNQGYDEFKNDPSAIHHFHIKALKLKENMNTETAKKMAQKRYDFMELFLQEFFNEWDGRK